MLLAACGGSSPDATTSTIGGLSIAIETVPSPAMMGDVEITLTIQDGQGAPVTGADVIVSADHTDMSGMTMSGQASEIGNGVYTIRANFSMSGNWMLSVDVKRDGQTETEEIPIIIQ
jgi:hypothetical protein